MFLHPPEDVHVFLDLFLGLLVAVLAGVDAESGHLALQGVRVVVDLEHRVVVAVVGLLALVIGHGDAGTYDLCY